MGPHKKDRQLAALIAEKDAEARRCPGHDPYPDLIALNFRLRNIGCL
jgi:hypothetical protein